MMCQNKSVKYIYIIITMIFPLKRIDEMFPENQADSCKNKYQYAGVINSLITKHFFVLQIYVYFN